MSVPASRPVETVRDQLAEQGLRRALAAMIRRKVPVHEVDEIVQATLADACASTTAPTEPDALERWVRGIARHKVADYHRRSRREEPVDTSSTALDELASAPLTDSSAHDAADLLRWAERENADRDSTLEWLLREGDGEKLQSIALDEKVPAARVRQRVARLRRHFRARWAAQIAAALALGIVVVTLFELRRPKPSPFVPVMTASIVVSARPVPVSPAIQLREVGLAHCASGAWIACLDALDRAAALDPAGDTADAVKGARAAAAEAQKPKPVSSVGTVKPPPRPVLTKPKPSIMMDNAY